jgi:hypothetical protein
LGRSLPVSGSNSRIQTAQASCCAANLRLKLGSALDLMHQPGTIVVVEEHASDFFLVLVSVNQSSASHSCLQRNRNSCGAGEGRFRRAAFMLWKQFAPRQLDSNESQKDADLGFVGGGPGPHCILMRLRAPLGPRTMAWVGELVAE